MGNVGFKILSVVAASGAAIVARKLTDGSWKFVTGGDSPQNPEDPDISWKEAIAFALLSGALMGLARMVAQREAAQVFQKSTGKVPPSLAKKED